MQFERPAEVNSAELDRLPGNRPEMVEISEIYQFNRGVYLRWVKPVLDVVIGLVALIVLSPVLLGVVLFVFVRMGRPILLRQRRVGRFGNEF